MKTYQLKFLAWFFSAFLPSDDSAEEDKADYYELLGVSKNAKADELKKAYRKKSLQLHPDKLRQRGMRYQGGIITEDEARSRFQSMKQAYDTLTDPKKRQIYDALGHQGMDFVINPSHAYDPHVLMGNLAKSTVFDRAKLMSLVCVFFGLVLLQPILICAKVDQLLADEGALESSSWIAIFAPFWLYSVLYAVLLIIGKAWLPLAHWTCFVVGVVFLTLKWDNIIDWSYAALFIPFYLWMLLRIVEAKNNINEVQLSMSKMVTIEYIEKYVINESNQDDDGNDIEDGNALHRNYNDLNEEERDEINKKYIIVHVPPKAQVPGEENEEEDEFDQIERSPEYQEARSQYLDASKAIQRIVIPEIPLIVLIAVQLDLDLDWNWGIIFLPIWISMVFECCGGCYGFFCTSALAHLEVQEQMEEHMDNMAAKEQEAKHAVVAEARDESADETTSELPDVSSMTIAELRKELGSYGIDHGGFCEKSDFTSAVQNARNPNASITAVNDTAESSKDEENVAPHSGIDTAVSVEPAVSTVMPETNASSEAIEIEDDDDDFEFEMDEDTFQFYQQAEVEAETKATDAQAKAIGSFCNIIFQAMIGGLFVGKLNQVYEDRDEEEAGTSSFSTFWILFPFFLIAGCFLSCFCCAIFCASDIDNVISTNDGGETDTAGDAEEAGTGPAPTSVSNEDDAVILTPQPPVQGAGEKDEGERVTSTSPGNETKESTDTDGLDDLD